jgi:hypothetical protein
MAVKRTYQELAALRPGGALGAAIARGENATRTLPRNPVTREILQELGERQERVGPPKANN